MNKVFLLIVAAVVITLLVPQRGMVELNAQRGEIWNEPTLLAPFDIPIVKSEEQIHQQREDINRNFQPVFRQDTSMLQGITDPVVRDQYLRGVIAQSEINNYRDKIIRIALGNTIHTLPIERLYVDSASLVANLHFDKELSAKLRQDELDNISLTRGVVRTGEVVILNGQLVDQGKQILMHSLKTEYENKIGKGASRLWVLLGRFVLVMMVLVINYLFFTRFAKYYFSQDSRHLLFILLLYIFIAALVSLSVRLGGLSPYMVPLPMVAIYLMTFFNMRVAIFGNISVAVICSLFVKVPFDFMVLNFVSGMVAVFMMRHMYHRGNFFKAVGVIFGVELLVMVCFVLMRDASFSWASLRNFAWLVVNNFLLLGFYQAIYLVERMFGFVSNLTLLELSDTNQQLLLSLAQQTPGTFQHSVQVANLAESAAKEIGANALLARCGSLYHDIGKMENPFYFVENLSGTFNPHNDLWPTDSARIVRAHVTAGETIAHKHKLPQKIIDFIVGHHGTSQIYYFLVEQQKLNTEFSLVDFTYPGPKPVSKEVSICMMADAVEAASRALPSYEQEQLDALVDKIIDSQISQEQFSNSELTFDEVTRIKTLFKQMLGNIYHARIAYPK